MNRIYPGTNFSKNYSLSEYLGNPLWLTSLPPPYRTGGWKTWLLGEMTYKKQLLGILNRTFEECLPGIYGGGGGGGGPGGGGGGG